MNPWTTLAIGTALALAGAAALAAGARDAGIGLLVASAPFDVLFALGILGTARKERT